MNVTMPLSISAGSEHSAAGKTDVNCALNYTAEYNGFKVQLSKRPEGNRDSSMPVILMVCM